jgi:hypothetical protein
MLAPKLTVQVGSIGANQSRQLEAGRKTGFFFGYRNDVSESALFDLKKSEVCHEANAQRRRKPPACRGSNRESRKTPDRIHQGISSEKSAGP